MSQNVKLILYSVKDIAAAKKLFGTFLNAEPYVDQPYYVGYKVGDMEVGLTPNVNKQDVKPPSIPMTERVGKRKEYLENQKEYLEDLKLYEKYPNLFNKPQEPTYVPVYVPDTHDKEQDYSYASGDVKAGAVSILSPTGIKTWVIPGALSQEDAIGIKGPKPKKVKLKQEYPFPENIYKEEQAA